MGWIDELFGGKCRKELAELKQEYSVLDESYDELNNEYGVFKDTTNTELTRLREGWGSCENMAKAWQQLYEKEKATTDPLITIDNMVIPVTSVAKARLKMNLYEAIATRLNVDVNLQKVTKDSYYGVISPYVSRLYLLDGTYNTVTLDEWKAIVAGDYTNMKKYLRDIFDCDDFARLFTMYVISEYAVNTIEVVIGQVVLSSVVYWHAWVAFSYLNSDGSFGARYLEPQNDMIFDLTRAKEIGYTAKFTPIGSDLRTATKGVINEIWAEN